MKRQNDSRNDQKQKRKWEIIKRWERIGIHAQSHLCAQEHEKQDHLNASWPTHVWTSGKQKNNGTNCEKLLLSEYLMSSHSLCEELWNMHKKQTSKTSTIWKTTVSQCTIKTLVVDNDWLHHAITRIRRIWQHLSHHRLIDEIYWSHTG